MKASFGFKANASDKERTKVEVELDFSKLSREQVEEYAAREVIRSINSEVREGKKKVEDVNGKTVEVKPLEVGTRGSKGISEDKALEKLAALHGITIDQIKALLQKAKGSIK